MSERRPPEPQEPVAEATPGCACGRCRRIKERQAGRRPASREQSGRMQYDADILGWQDAGSENPKEGRKFGYLRPAEAADRRERDESGLKELPAAYRPLIGPPPQLKFGDRVAALTYLRKIEAAIEVGGWTRSEWRRLRALQAKWKARATGNDPRFETVGNRNGGLTPPELARVRERKLLKEMRESLGKSPRGD